MKKYHTLLTMYTNALQQQQVADDVLGFLATKLKEAFDALEEWEQDLLCSTCNAEICDIIFK